jgi:hypothetical protein
MVSQAVKERAEALRLSPEQLGVLGHLRTFRVSTAEVVRELFFEEGTSEGVKSFLQRLRARGLIASADLFGTTDYHFLTNDGLRLFGDPPKRTVGLNSSALAEAYGVLRFCASSGHRKKLRKQQFQTQFPELATRGVRATNYYLDDEETPRRIGFIYVDRGIETSKVGRRVGSVAIKKRLEDSSWRTQVLHSRRFAVGIVTPTEHKVATLRARLEREWEYVTFRFHVVPELLLIRDRRRHASG